MADRVAVRTLNAYRDVLRRHDYSSARQTSETLGRCGSRCVSLIVYTGEVFLADVKNPSRETRDTVDGYSTYVVDIDNILGNAGGHGYDRALRQFMQHCYFVFEGQNLHERQKGGTCYAD